MSQTRKFQGTARKMVRGKEATLYYYHKTAVVVDNKATGEIVLNSDGWRTATTKTAMNQASAQDSLGFQVFQDKGVWYVKHNNQVHTYCDGLVLRSGE